MIRERLLYLLVLIPILALSLYLHLNRVEPFENFSLKFNDVNFDLQKKEPNKDVVFVAVDERSVNEFGRWPFDRSDIAKGLDGLRDADVVLLDMIFSEHTTKEKDLVLAESIASLNSSVCGFFLRKNSTQSISHEELDILADSSLDLLQSQIAQHENPLFIHAPFAEMNIVPIMQACSMSGSFSTISESDHLFRSYPIAIYFDNLLYPSLAMQGLRLRFNKDIKRVDADHIEIEEHLVELNKKGFVRLNFYETHLYNIISFVDVANKKIEPEYFKNKIVILGITDVGAGDVVSTPMGQMPGPLLHYTFISNLLEGHLIKEPKNTTVYLVVFMVLLPFILVLFFKKIVYRVVINIVTYLLIYIYIRYLFVNEMLYIDLFYPLISLVISFLSIEAMAFNLQEKRGKFMRGAFSSYLSANLLDKLIQNPEALALGGESKELSILFSDIRGFTSISESMSPVSLITLLNRYFTPMTDAVLNNGGMLDKYIGDAVMAFFNAPVDVKNHADAACLSALEMIEKLDALNKELLNEGLNAIKIGIGINTAEVVVGNMGSDTRFNYTVIGDGVNLASRVEGLTKNYGVNILITEFTQAKLKSDFVYREIESVKVKGKNEAVLLYELMPNSENSKKIKELYDEALSIYKSGDFKRAETLFSILAQDYNDVLAKYFLPLIQEKQAWGIHKMQTK